MRGADNLGGGLIGLLIIGQEHGLLVRIHPAHGLQIGGGGGNLRWRWLWPDSAPPEALAPSPVERPTKACSSVPEVVVLGVVQSVAMRWALLPLELPPGVRVRVSPLAGVPVMGNCQYWPEAAPELG